MIAKDRLPPLPESAMNEAQKKAAADLIAGPRGGVKGPFIPLMRSPDLMDRIGRVGEYLRFKSALPQRLNEFTTCVVSRRWSQQFEWAIHYAAAEKAGVPREVLDALSQGARPNDMQEDEALAYDFYAELDRSAGVSDATYARAISLLGEQGVVELTSLIGYFTLMAMILNVARTPAATGGSVAPLQPFPA
jgi:4-carboxymuconolactone decarboxylase